MSSAQQSAPPPRFRGPAVQEAAGSPAADAGASRVTPCGKRVLAAEGFCWHQLCLRHNLPPSQTLAGTPSSAPGKHPRKEESSNLSARKCSEHRLSTSPVSGADTGSLEVLSAARSGSWLPVPDVQPVGSPGPALGCAAPVLSHTSKVQPLEHQKRGTNWN